MIHQVINIQKTLNHFCMYTKQLMLSYTEEFGSLKIHFRRLTVMLERLFVNEQQFFKDFFVNDKRSKPIQFLDYLVRSGEIISVGEGYYILPPERTVQILNDKYVSVSNIQKVNSSKFGLASRVEGPSKITLTLDEFLYRPTLEDLFGVYQASLISEHDIEPDSIIYFTNSRVYKSESQKGLVENEYYILNFERQVGSKLIPEKYFAQWKNNKWYVVQIKIDDYLRLFLSLKVRKGFTDFYSIAKNKNDICELKVTTSLPKEEIALLALITTPTSNVKCKTFYFHENDRSIIEGTLQRCNLVSERESKLGIYN